MRTKTGGGNGNGKKRMDGRNPGGRRESRILVVFFWDSFCFVCLSPKSLPRFKYFKIRFFFKIKATVTTNIIIKTQKSFQKQTLTNIKRTLKLPLFPKKLPLLLKISLKVTKFSQKVTKILKKSQKSYQIDFSKKPLKPPKIRHSKALTKKSYQINPFFFHFNRFFCNKKNIINLEKRPQNR